MISEFTVGKWPEKKICGDHSVYCCKNCQRKGSPAISEFTVGKNDQRKGSPVIMQFAVGEKWPEKRISGDHAIYC